MNRSRLVVRWGLAGVLFGGLAGLSLPPPDDTPLRVLVFSKTAGYRHDSIQAGVEAITALGREHGFEVEATEDAGWFTDEHLPRFGVVVFLSTTGDVLNDAQERAFERYIGAGGGWVGIHAAADTEYEWPFYGGLVGAYFKSHPAVQQATIVVEDREHPSTAHLEERWVRRDEWYDYGSNPREALPGETPGRVGGAERPRVRVLASLMASSYRGSIMGDDHPIAWCHEYAGGRAWYTGGGHTTESFAEAEFVRHIAGGILWASGRE